MPKIDSRPSALKPWGSVVFWLSVMLVMAAPFVIAPGVAVADDDDSPPVNFTPAELKRARLLFRHYCMDCHGPKMTGDEFDENLLCPDVQGKDRDDYAEAIIDGPDEMPEFQVTFVPNLTDGYLVLSVEDYDLLTQHETTFRPNQP